MPALPGSWKEYSFSQRYSIKVSIHGIGFAFLLVQWKLLETVKGEKCMFMETGGVVFLPIFTVAARAFESPPLDQLAALRFRYLHFCSAHRTP